MPAGPPYGTGPPCPPPIRARCQVPLCAVLYPPPRRGTLAGPVREAWPDQSGAARKRPGLAGERKASRPCPAPHQAGHRPNNRPPLPAAPPPPAVPAPARNEVTRRNAQHRERPAKPQWQFTGN
jgi:hypothetical protein